MQNVIILGCGRSGTSMVAGSLAQSGYWMGEDLYEPDEFNQKGYFEDPSIVDINECILATEMESPLVTLSSNPDPEQAPNGERWLGVLPVHVSLKADEESAARIRQKVRRAPFCFKDPRFSGTLDAWRPFLTDCRYVCVFRDPASTATSLLKICRGFPHLRTMDLFTWEHALQLWRTTYQRILEVHSQSGEWFFLAYDQMFETERARKLSQFLDAPVNVSFPNRSLTTSESEQGTDAEAHSLMQTLLELASS